MNKNFIKVTILDLFMGIILSTTTLFYPTEYSKGALILFVIFSQIILILFAVKGFFQFLLRNKIKLYSKVFCLLIVLITNFLFLPIEDNDLNPFRIIGFSFFYFLISFCLLFIYNKLINRYSC